MVTLTEHTQAKNDVTLDAMALYIQKWQTSNPVVLGYLAQADQTKLTTELENLLVVGATVMNTARPTLDLGHVKREFDNFQSRLYQAHADFFSDSGQVSRLLSDANQTIAAYLKHYMDESSTSSVGAVIQKRVEDLLRKQVQSWQEQFYQLFDSSQPNSPANSMVRVVQEHIATVQSSYLEIRDLLNQQTGRNAESKRGTHKGRLYEDAACDVLQELARLHLDTFQATGSYAGIIPGCKKGDAVVTLNPTFTKSTAARIVFEMKDRKLEAAEVKAELEQAIQNREAHIAIAVLAGTDIRATGGLPLGQWDDKCYFCVLDRDSYDSTALSLVYAQARLAAFKTSSYSGEVSFALGEIKTELEGAMAAFKTRTAIKACLATGVASLKEAQLQVDNLTDITQTKLQRIQKLLEIAENN